MDSFDRITEVRADWASTVERVVELRTAERKKVVSEWNRSMQGARAEHDELVKTGKWVSGPSHLLDVIGKARWETYHSAILAWLLNPIAPHGLGSRFLERFLTAIDPGFEWAKDLSAVVPRTEVWKGNSRADIVLLAPEFRVVVEVKVDADEQPKQCLRLFRDWTAGSPAYETFFAFLTPHGDRRPKTATDEATDAFTGLGFHQVEELLRQAMEIGPSRTEWPGRAVVDAYARTLTEEFAMTTPNHDKLEAPVEFYLKHRKDIEEWAQLKDREREAADRFFESVAAPLEERVAEISPQACVYSSFDEPCRKVFLCREEWKDSGRPRVATGLEWVDREGFRYYRLGVWVNREADPDQRLHNAVVERLERTDQPGQPRKTWWASKEEVRPGDRFWEDLPALRSRILDRIEKDWERCAPLLDEALQKHRQPA